jgi:hypothetical protein
MKGQEGFLHLALLASRGLPRVHGRAILSIAVALKVKGAEGADVAHSLAVHGKLPHELHDLRRRGAHRVPQNKRSGEDR